MHAMIAEILPIPPQALCLVLYQLVRRSKLFLFRLSVSPGFQHRIWVSICGSSQRRVSLIIQGTIWYFKMADELLQSAYYLHTV